MNRLSQPQNVLRAIVVVALASIAFFATGTLAEEFDLVILNGRVIDPESKLDAVRNVGVKDGKIAKITKKSITGTESIDASGHVVAPGFIDMHNHNTAAPFGQKLALRDGVTTPMELEAGVYPIGEWYAALEGKSQSNYGASVGTIPVRENLLQRGLQVEVRGRFPVRHADAGRHPHVDEVVDPDRHG